MIIKSYCVKGKSDRSSCYCFGNSRETGVSGEASTKRIKKIVITAMQGEGGYSKKRDGAYTIGGGSSN